MHQRERDQRRVLPAGFSFLSWYIIGETRFGSACTSGQLPAAPAKLSVLKKDSRDETLKTFIITFVFDRKLWSSCYWTWLFISKHIQLAPEPLWQKCTACLTLQAWSWLVRAELKLAFCRHLTYKTHWFFWMYIIFLRFCSLLSDSRSVPLLVEAKIALPYDKNCISVKRVSKAFEVQKGVTYLFGFSNFVFTKRAMISYLTSTLMTHVVRSIGETEINTYFASQPPSSRLPGMAWNGRWTRWKYFYKTPSIIAVSQLKVGINVSSDTVCFTKNFHLSLSRK